VRTPERDPQGTHPLRPPSPRERVLAATTEALLGRRQAVPPTLVVRLIGTLGAAPGARRKRP